MPIVGALGVAFLMSGVGPLGPLGFNFSQHGPTTRPSVEKTAEKAFMLSDRCQVTAIRLLAS